LQYAENKVEPVIGHGDPDYLFNILDVFNRCFVAQFRWILLLPA